MRRCEQCGTTMAPFEPRIRMTSGLLGCSGCHALSFKKVSVLPNPAGQGKAKDEWYHGSPHAFEELDTDPGHYQDYDEEYEQGRFKHWNTLIGPHFGSQHFVARDFAEGSHGFTGHGNEDEYDEHQYEGPMQHVVHVKLHIKNPKVYDSEYDMDHEVHAHELAQGNTFQKHFPKPDEDDDPEYHDEYEEAEHKFGKEYLEADKPFGPREMDERGRPKSTKWLSRHPDKAGIAQRYKRRMEKEGHDGVIYGNEYEGGGKAAIAFHPHQVEETQHHYGPVCLTEEQIQERKQIPGQGHLEGMEDMSHRRRPVDPKFMDPYLDWTKTNHPGWSPGPHAENIHGQRPLFPPLATASIRHIASAQGPFFHGTASELQPGDLVDPERELGGKKGRSYAYMTLDPEAAHNYGKYKAQARWVIGDDDASPRAYEVEPTGPVEPDDTVDERFQAWRSRHPLRVVREIHRGHIAAQQPYGEQSALNEMGKQDVYAVRSGDTMVNLCEYHRDVHVGNSRAADSLGAGLGIGARERSAETLGEARKGRCAACGKDTAYQLKLLTPRSMQSRYREERQPRRRGEPYVPTKTGPLPSLKQSENARNVFLYHGNAHDPETTHDYDDREGDYTIHPRSMGGKLRLHTDESKAWHDAIEHWNDDETTEFPQVYRVSRKDLPAHLQDQDGPTLVSEHPIRGYPSKYDADDHPPIKLRDEEGPILYHGTSHEVGDEISPASEVGAAPTYGYGVADPGYAYATKNPSTAWHYAEHRADYGPGGHPKVYRVRPKDSSDLEEDPAFEGQYSRGNFSGDMRSKKGFHVLDEVPMPHGMRMKREPMEDDDDDWGESHYGVKLANQQMELFHAEPTGKPRSPKAEWHRKMTDEHSRPKDGDVDDEDEYEPDECEHCGEDKNSEDHEEVHHDWLHSQKWHTDWDEDRTVGAHNNGEIQRGMAISLPQHIHDVVHDEDRPLHERGKALAEHVIKSANDEGHIGRFWTDEDSVSRSYAANSSVKLGSKDDHGTPDTPVVLHVKFPGYHHIETDPDELENHGVYSYHIETNREVPLQHGTPLEAVGVSWVHHRYGRHGGRHWDADNADWKRHDFKEPIKAMSSKKSLPTLRMLAHDATENQAIMHCPFCGGGKVIGRADGTVECEFCGSYFTVQVQPQYPNFPQTVNGQPQQVPGMPGDIETPGGSLGGDQMPSDGLGDEGADEDGNPFAEDGDGDLEDAEDDGGDEEPPPFAKKSFRTVTGAVLHEDDYVRHLAIRAAPDRDAMIAHIRSERGAR